MRKNISLTLSSQINISSLLHKDQSTNQPILIMQTPEVHFLYPVTSPAASPKAVLRETSPPFDPNNADDSAAAQIETCLHADELTNYDVICGRSKFAFSNFGNRRFRVTIALFLDDYVTNTSGYDRSRLTQKIMNLIWYDCGGRFLKNYQNRAWVELDEVSIRNKVAHALRDAAAVKYSNIPTTRTGKKLLQTKKMEAMVEPLETVQSGDVELQSRQPEYYQSGFFSLKQHSEEKMEATVEPLETIQSGEVELHNFLSGFVSVKQQSEEMMAVTPCDSLCSFVSSIIPEEWTSLL
jgi:hypothetical protein